jgi:hypothetical protein
LASPRRRGQPTFAPRRPRRASLREKGRDRRPAPARQEKANFTHPDRIGQLAGEHHHQMLAKTSQRQLRHQHGRPAASTRVIGRLTRRSPGPA